MNTAIQRPLPVRGGSPLRTAADEANFLRALSRPDALPRTCSPVVRRPLGVRSRQTPAGRTESPRLGPFQKRFRRQRGFRCVCAPTGITPYLDDIRSERIGSGINDIRSDQIGPNIDDIRSDRIGSDTNDIKSGRIDDIRSDPIRFDISNIKSNRIRSDIDHIRCDLIGPDINDIKSDLIGSDVD